MKNVAVSLMAIFFAACSGNKSPHSLQQEKEDLSAKGLLQGIWLDDETESPLRYYLLCRCTKYSHCI